MSEAIVGTIVGALIAVFVVVIQQRYASKREERRRQWELEDAARANRRAVIERRCQQVEDVLESFTEHFYRILDDGNFLLVTRDKQHADARPALHISWLEQRDGRHFANVQAIHTLHDERLITSWKKMTELGEEMAKCVTHVWSERWQQGRLVNTEEISDKMVSLRAAFDMAGGDMRAQLDRIRGEVE